MSAHRRAFASIFALFLVALVAAALLAVTSLMTTDVRRTTRAAVDAQLRELLHAGAVTALQRLRDEGELPDASFDVTLPPSLGAAVHVAPDKLFDDTNRAVIVRAMFGDREASQRVAFERVGQSWRVRAVEVR